MQLAFFLNLVATTSAINVIGYTESNPIWNRCGGTFTGCQNLNPNTCCRFAKFGLSLAIDHIPGDWRVELRAYGKQGCDESDRQNFYYRGSQTSKGCAAFGAWSAGYGLNTFNKRFQTGDGSECQAADFMGFEDGTLYNITAMGQDLTQTLLSYDNATSSADVPEQFKEFEFTM